MAVVPNTTPIYVKDVINWRARLTTQVVGRKPTVESPVLLGAFGDFGGLLWSIRAVPLGANVATTLLIHGAPAGSTSPASLSLLFEAQLPTIYDPAVAYVPVGTNSYTNTPTPIEISLPRIYSRNTEESRGLVRTTGFSIYASLSTAVAGGWDILVEGGNY